MHKFYDLFFIKQIYAQSIEDALHKCEEIKTYRIYLISFLNRLKLPGLIPR